MSLLSIFDTSVTHFIVLIVSGSDIFLFFALCWPTGFKQSAFACLGAGAGIILWIVLTAFGLKSAIRCIFVASA